MGGGGGGWGRGIVKFHATNSGQIRVKFGQKGTAGSVSFFVFFLFFGWGALLIFKTQNSGKIVKFRPKGTAGSQAFVCLLVYLFLFCFCSSSGSSGSEDFFIFFKTFLAWIQDYFKFSRQFPSK